MRRGAALRRCHVWQCWLAAPARFYCDRHAANIAARISDQCKALDQSLLLSAEVARRAPNDPHSLGKQKLRHVGEHMELFAVGGDFG
jgi:hypothetical protein